MRRWVVTTAEIVDLALDPQWLSDQMGSAATLSYLRIKPGHSLAMSIQVPEGRQWARIVWPSVAHKADKAAKYCRRRGVELRRMNLPGGLLLVAGPILTDPRIASYLGNYPDAGACQVLRHNPLRRLVLRCGDQVYRVTSAAQDHLLAIHTAFADLPIPPLNAAPASARTGKIHETRQPFYAAGDLAGALSGASDLTAKGWASPCDAAHAQAGRILAALHAHAPGPLASASSIDDPYRIAVTHSRVVALLDAKLARRIHAIAARVPTLSGPLVASHGDASPDQFLLGPHGLLLSDFDRARLAPAVMDLGSYLHCAGEQARGPFVDAYREVAAKYPNGRGDRHLPHEAALRAGQALAALKRLAEPLRLGRRDWADEVHGRIDALEGTLR